MSLHRYLMNIAYLGTAFRGAQRQVPGGILPRVADPLTIQGRLEMGCKYFNSVNEPIVILSSRTDSGVHAINSTCHVDLIRGNGQPYDPGIMTIQLNKYFKKVHLPIRILKTCIVPQTFHCRHNAISRTYLYRLILGQKVNESVKLKPLSTYFPIEEWDRCYFYCPKNAFDVKLMKEAAKMMEGLHDFRTFMKKFDNSEYKNTRRNIDFIKIIDGPIKHKYSSYSWPPLLLRNDMEYLSIDVYIKSAGFLYRQVRRTVAALAAVAQGKVTLRDIKFMLEVPSYRSWCPQINTVPAQGLYLCEVEYSKEDLATFRTVLEV